MKAPTATTATATRSGRLRRTAPVIAILAGLALCLAACGGGSGGPGSNTGKKSPAQDVAGTGPVAFAQCMRSHGVTDFPDPQNGHFLISGNVQSNPSFQTATQACQHLLGPNGASNGGANGSKLLAFSHCMQTHGVPQFPDPTANGALDVHGVDPNSPAFKNAYRECQSKLPGNVQGQP
jgi:hypothetical protein